MIAQRTINNHHIPFMITRLNKDLIIHINKITLIPFSSDLDQGI